MDDLIQHQLLAMISSERMRGDIGYEVSNEEVLRRIITRMPNATERELIEHMRNDLSAMRAILAGCQGL